MSEQITADEILSRNPQVDREQLERVGAIMRHLQEKGVRRKGYEIASPSERRRMPEQEDGRNDPRAIRLRRSSRVK